MVTVGGFSTAPTRIHGERERRLALATRRLSYHHSFLDDCLRGILPNDLVLVGASTGAGKTDLVVSIAKANARAKRRVHFFALEAEPDEVERRAKYAFLVELALKANHPRRDELNYADWMVGRCEDVCAPYEQAANQLVLEQLSTLRTFYRGRRFGAADLERAILEVHEDTDLVVVDHLHYIDTDTDESEARALGDAVKTIRDVALRIGKPVILVAHLRKSDLRARQVVPSAEDFHGTSNVIKIATQVVLLTPARSVESPKWYLAPTFVHVPKDRRNGETGLVALCFYDRRYRSYLAHYTLGRLMDGGTRWEPIKPGDAPRWAHSHRSGEP